MITPIQISPFARRSQNGQLTLQQIIDKYDFSNAWSSENLTIAGTTTTALDYMGVHDLSNPSVVNQPTLNASDPQFGSKPSLSFTTDDYLIKNVANFNNFNNGFQIDVLKSTISPRALVTSDNGTNGRYINGYSNGGKVGFELVFITNRITANTLVYDNTKGNVLAWASNGSSYVVSLNGQSNVGANLNIISGGDTGEWFNDIGLRDNISIGARISLTPLYFNMDWVFSGVGNNFSEADLNALTLDLKNYYKL